jgi:hypothetical protein
VERNGVHRQHDSRGTPGTGSVTARQGTGAGGISHLPEVFSPHCPLRPAVPSLDSVVKTPTSLCMNLTRKYIPPHQKGLSWSGGGGAGTHLYKCAGTLVCGKSGPQVLSLPISWVPQPPNWQYSPRGTSLGTLLPSLGPGSPGLSPWHFCPSSGVSGVSPQGLALPVRVCSLRLPAALSGVGGSTHLTWAAWHLG